MLTLREILIERIHFAVDETTLQNAYALTGDDLQQLSDIDLFEIYEEVTLSTPGV